MSGRQAKRARKALRRAGRGLSPEEVRLALTGLESLGFISVEGGVPDDPDTPMNVVFNTHEHAIALALANPNVYKTPKGNLLTLKGADGIDRWMTPAEAVAWQVNADVIDRKNPKGMRP